MPAPCLERHYSSSPRPRVWERLQAGCPQVTNYLTCVLLTSAPLLPHSPENQGRKAHVEKPVKTTPTLAF